MALVQKWPFFQTFFFQAIQARRISFTIFQNEKTPFYAIKTKNLKSRKLHIFPKGLTHCFGPKMAIFPNLFFLGNIGKGNVFYNILQQKNSFLGYKNKNFKIQKIDYFLKGRTHGFGQKMAIFYTFFLGNIGKGNVFYDILERKTSFLGLKNKKFKKSKK